MRTVGGQDKYGEDMMMGGGDEEEEEDKADDEYYYYYYYDEEERRRGEEISKRGKSGWIRGKIRSGTRKLETNTAKATKERGTEDRIHKMIDEEGGRDGGME